jgi:hypothetical protein
MLKKNLDPGQASGSKKRCVQKKRPSKGLNKSSRRTAAPAQAESTQAQIARLLREFPEHPEDIYKRSWWEPPLPPELAEQVAAWRRRPRGEGVQIAEWMKFIGPSAETRAIFAKFAQLARVPASRADDFLSWVINALDDWSDAVALKGRTEDDFINLVTDVRHKTAALCRSLENLRQHRELKGAPIYWLAGDVLGRLSVLADLLYRYPHKQGRPRGAKNYPGVETLVFILELGARKCNGRFTLDKRHGKGTLIQALDWLRAYCLDTPEWRWNADFLPPPGRHPLAVYETAIRKARAGLPYPKPALTDDNH